MSIDPNYYREKAQQTLRLASRTKDAETKAYLRQVAQQYEKLAAEAEQKCV
jgi:hypothetical protein